MESYEDRKKAWEEMEVSPAELHQLTECMKRPEFRELLREYAEEVSDPANRQLYETELAQLERERGFDVRFVHPEPGYVLKTSLDGSCKCFLNVSQSELVAKPSSRLADERQPSAGLHWSIPHLLAPPRDELDRGKRRCRVFDVVFHPDALYLAKRNPGFKRILDDTAMDGVEGNFKVKLDRKNLRFPKMNYKGVSQPTVIRKPCEKPVEKLDIEPEIYQKLMSSYDEHRERHSKPREEKPKRAAPESIRYFNSRDNETDEPDSDYTTPKFVVKHQTYLDMDEFRESRDAKLHATTPKNLVVEVNLPLLKSAADASLDVQERHLSLKSDSPAKYQLELPLSYRVEPDKGSAKFDAKTKKLSVTLPVLPETWILADGKEDSGVESDHGSPLPESRVSPGGGKLARDNSSDSDKPSSEALAWELSEGSDVLSDCADTALRTSDDEKFAAPFLDPNVKYSLPAFTCNVYDSVLAVTIHAKNVEPDSIRHRILENDAGLHVLLTSIGAGYFPVYYSLCLKLGSDVVVAESLAVEPWDNNVVLSVKIRHAETLARYHAGINEELLEVKDLTAAASIKNKLQALEEDPGLETDKNVEVIRSGNEVIVNVNGSDSANAQSAYTDDDDDEHDRESISQGEERKRNFAQSRSISESSGDELPSSIGSANGSIRYKSILKSRHFSRSVSESSIDYDSAAHLSSVAFNDSVHELLSESEGSSLKKTVRFNDVVSRQLYRSNSSILGQRKKNQRKLRNKKRAHERRMSESENSETEDREKYKVEAKKEPERDTSDAVRPILHQNNKSSTETAIIEIERTPRGSTNKRKQKRNPEGKISANKSDDKAKTESHSEEESFDAKNDLMFDLEV